MDLVEDLLPHTLIGRRLFLLEEGIQVMVAVEAKVLSLGWELVARPCGGIVGIIEVAVCPLGDIIPSG